MKYRLLIGAHDPGDPAEATLVLAAAAALNGLKADGAAMPEDFGHRPTQSEIARELNMHVSAVRRGLRHLSSVGAVTHHPDGVEVYPEALATRWQNKRQHIQITQEARQLRLRAKPLLLAALVTHQRDPQGQLRLGVQFLMERTGFSQRTVERTLATCRRARALHTWWRATRGDSYRRQLWLAIGPSQNGGSSESQGGGSRQPQDGTRTRDASADAEDTNPKSAPSRNGGSPIAKRRFPHREMAVPPSQSGGRQRDCHQDCHQDLQQDVSDLRSEHEPTAPEPRSATSTSQPSPAQQPPPTPDFAVIDVWVAAFGKKGIEVMDPGHAFDVMGLLDRLGRAPGGPADRCSPAVRKERLELARRVIAWCPPPERLGRWLRRVSGWYGVQNLGTLLRRATDKGTGRAASNRVHKADSHFTASGEPVAEGERHRLREQVRLLLDAERRDAARDVLRQLVGDARGDIALTTAIGAACSLATAKELLAA